MEPTYLQFPRLFELLHITLPFERRACGQEYVFVLTIDILCPVRQPGYCLVVNNIFPFAGHIWNRNRNAFPDIDGNVFGTYAELRTMFRTYIMNAA